MPLKAFGQSNEDMGAYLSLEIYLKDMGVLERIKGVDKLRQGVTFKEAKETITRLTATTFESSLQLSDDTNINTNQYMFMLLEGLGYSSERDKISEVKSLDQSYRLGILGKGEYAYYKGRGSMDRCLFISMTRNALFKRYKGSKETMSYRLLKLGRMDKEDYLHLNYNPVSEKGDTRTKTLVLGFDEEEGTLDPLTSNGKNERLINLIFNGLLRRDQKGGYDTEVALSYQVSPDQKVYTFKLKDTIYFSDGNKIKPEDVIFTYETSGDKKLFDEVILLEDGSLQFYMKEPLKDLNIFTKGIVPKAYYQQLQSGGTGKSTFGLQPIGTGPYMATFYQPYGRLLLEKNPYYKLSDYPLQRLQINFGESPYGLATGELDFYQGEIYEDIIALVEGKSYLLMGEYRSNEYSYLGFNCKMPTLTDVKVRQALLYGYDRKGYVTDLFGDTKNIQNVPSHPLSFGYSNEAETNLQSYDRDVKMAAKLLDEAGWIMNNQGFREKDGQNLTLVYGEILGNEFSISLGKRLVQEWSQLGVQLYRKSYTKEQFELELAKGDDRSFDVFFGQDKMDYYEMDLKKFLSANNVYNYFNLNNDFMIKKIENEEDAEKFINQYDGWLKHFNQEVPMQVLYVKDHQYIYNERLIQLPIFWDQGLSDGLRRARLLY